MTHEKLPEMPGDGNNVVMFTSRKKVAHPDGASEPRGGALIFPEAFSRRSEDTPKRDLFSEKSAEALVADIEEQTSELVRLGEECSLAEVRFRQLQGAISQKNAERQSRLEALNERRKL